MIGKTRVPNEGPLNASIYLVGEAPGADEVSEGRPFIGTSGTLLRDCLARAGASIEEIRISNLCQFRPENNVFRVLLNSRELREGIEELAADIRANNPVVIGALGNWPLYFLTGKCGKKGPGSGITKWRGSILPCTLPGCEHIKVVACAHPAFIARQREEYPVFSFDIQRVVQDSAFREFRYPERELVLDPRGEELDRWANILVGSEWLDCDIETVKGSTRILCHGFSPRPDLSVVISHSETDAHRQAVLEQIYASQARKCFHNGFGFDLIQLKINGFTVENYEWDTQIAQHVMWAELPKSLDYLCSIYTRQPYYKTAGRAEIPEDGKSWDGKFDKTALYEYNGTDTSVTSAVRIAQMEEVKNGPAAWSRKIRDLMDLTGPAIRISLAGLPVDEQRIQTLKRALETRWAVAQFVLDRLTGFKTNVNSPKAMARILYDKDKMNLPPRRNRDGSLTTNEDAIVSLIGYTKDYISKLKPGGAANQYWQTRHEVLKTILLIRGIRKVLSSYINVPRREGKLFSTYKVTGAETLRWSSAKFVDGTGLNGQTFPRLVIELKNYEDMPELRDALKYILELEQEDAADPEGAAEEHDSSTEGSPVGEL